MPVCCARVLCPCDVPVCGAHGAADGRVSYRDLKGDRVYLSDTCVPISNISQMISETEADFLAAGFPCIICAHIADGNFHCCIPYQPEDYSTVKEIETRMIKRALSLEGTVSGEHGVGVGKIDHILEVTGTLYVYIYLVCFFGGGCF